MAGPLRVGIIGCGEVTQIIHLPALHELRDLFTVTALCDVSPAVLGALGAMHPAARCHADYRKLLADPDVDVVLVGNPDEHHSDVRVSGAVCGGRKRHG